MKPLLFFALTLPALGQVTIIPVAPATVQRGTTFNLSINSGGATATGPAGEQWTLVLPAGWAASVPATTVPGKVVSCAPTNLMCLLYGPTTTAVIPNGAVASLSITVPPTAPLGAATISTTGTLAVSETGGAIPSTGGSLSITVTPDPRDIDGNGTVDQSDVTAAVVQIFGACTTADVDRDGKCDLLDLIVVVLKAQGKIP